MLSDNMAEYFKRGHLGERNAATARELEGAFDVSTGELWNTINTLRRSGVPIASSARGYFYAATAQEVRTTITRMSHRIIDIARAIDGLNESLGAFDAAQTGTPPDGGGGP